ncbi:inner membrane complex protein 1g [Plasmodium gonderi]|uniref:Inner membrane complex protein 1g n=1 Tax=Plasmodium gonderi TaxID=77519 RepID=A0A1Y1JFI9_PLAGO|nr:inner membrane complex protein 1g [Plasmodium gonderi]GAW81299.1 inner membrane complex protein 1g [Plasmodium gonderi]
MCSTNQKLTCCSGDNVFESKENENDSYPQMVNKQLPPKVLEPIVQNKIVEVPKEVYLEKIVEVPQIKTVERIVEQIRPIIQYKNVYKTKTVYVEKIKNIDRIIYQEKIIEVPQIKTVEKVVEVPVYVNRERIITVPRYMVVEKVIPVLKTSRKESTKEIPEINCPNIDITKEVEEKEEIAVEDIKENQTINVSYEKSISLMNELNIQKLNSNGTLNADADQDTTMDTVNQENFCTTVSCKFLPIYDNFPKFQSSVCKGLPEREKRFSSMSIYKSKDSGFPKIRISKTPQFMQKNCYCNYA